jgi:OOP family OmpA-OmpF porin
MNMKFAAATVLGLLSLAALAPTAAAADNGFYLGAGVTNTNFDASIGGLSDDSDDNGYKIIAGFRPFNWLAFEANYMDLGGIDEAGLEIDSTALTASALVLAEIGIVDLYARVGMANWDSDFTVQGVGRTSDDGWEPTYGAGVGVHFGSIGVRAEYERFSTEALNDQLDTDVGIVSVSFTYTFL